jgi:hypothetical protein
VLGRQHGLVCKWHSALHYIVATYVCCLFVQSRCSSHVNSMAMNEKISNLIAFLPSLIFISLCPDPSAVLKTLTELFWQHRTGKTGHALSIIEGYVLHLGRWFTERESVCMREREREGEREKERSERRVHVRWRTHLSLGSLLVKGYLCEAVKTTGCDPQLTGPHPVDARTGELARALSVSHGVRFQQQSCTSCPPRFPVDTLPRWQGGEMHSRVGAQQARAPSFGLHDSYILNSCIFLFLTLFSYRRSGLTLPSR